VEKIEMREEGWGLETKRRGEGGRIQKTLRDFRFKYLIFVTV
jgi:hypothetical protein